MLFTLPLFIALLATSGFQEKAAEGPKRFGHSRGFGKSVLVLSDLNADGVSEIAVGFPLDNAVVVISGKDRSTLQTWKGDRNTIFMGTELSLIGDVNGDGTLDVLVGFNPYFYTEEEDYCEVRSGLDGSLLRILRICSKYVFAFGDLDLDGASDLALSRDECLEVVSGRTGESLALQPHAGSHTQLWLGADRNGDGLADGVLVGEELALLLSDGYLRGLITIGFPSMPRQSPVALYPKGRRIPLKRLAGQNWPSSLVGLRFIFDAGDLNGDGREDLLVHHPRKKHLGLLAFSWATPELSMYRLPPTYKDTEGSQLDYVVAAGMQLDGGQAPDLVLCDYDQVLNIRLQARSGEKGELLWQTDLYDLGGPTFASLAPMPDLNGDGIDEVMLGMYDPKAHGPLWEGRLQALSGATGKVLWRIEEWDVKR